jgi:hypothetical protein
LKKIYFPGWISAGTELPADGVKKIEEDVMCLLRSKKIGIRLVVLWLTLFMAC